MDVKKLKVEDLEKGYVSENDCFHCLYCDFTTDRNKVYPYAGSYYIAEARIKIHLQEEHSGSLHALLNLPKKSNTLTDNQKTLIAMLGDNKTDKEIAGALGITESTVRHQRFTLREKTNQAKTFLAIMNCLEKSRYEDDFLRIHANAKQVDERYAATKADEEKVKADFFESLDPLILRTIPRKEKYKIIVLRLISSRFEAETDYSEKEVNQTLQMIFSDYVTLRRYLIEYGFFERDTEGRIYRKTC